MSDTHTYSSDVAFTPTVKAIQARKGSREAYAHVEARGGWRTEIDDKLAGVLANTNSFYLATASADGQPYIQHRGGPKGFVKILDKNTIAFADCPARFGHLLAGWRIPVTPVPAWQNRRPQAAPRFLTERPAAHHRRRG